MESSIFSRAFLTATPRKSCFWWCGPVLTGARSIGIFSSEHLCVLASYSAAIVCGFGGLFSSDCLWFQRAILPAIAGGFWRAFQQRLPVVFSELFSRDYQWFSANYSAAIACGFQRIIQQRLPVGFQRTFQQALPVAFSELFSRDYQWFSASYSAAIACGFQRSIEQRLCVVFSELSSQRLQGFLAGFSAAIACGFQRAFQLRLWFFNELFIFQAVLVQICRDIAEILQIIVRQF